MLGMQLQLLRACGEHSFIIGMLLPRDALWHSELAEFDSVRLNNVMLTEQDTAETIKARVLIVCSACMQYVMH